MQKTTYPGTLKSPDPTMRMLYTRPKTSSCLPYRMHGPVTPPMQTINHHFCNSCLPLACRHYRPPPLPHNCCQKFTEPGSSGQLYFFGGGCARSPANENIWGSGQWQNFAGPHGPAKYSSVPIGPAAQRTETLLRPHPPSPASSLVCWCVHSSQLK